jgi:uncharacterized membrane protein YphA (DoxX/SURF4 family)
MRRELGRQGVAGDRKDTPLVNLIGKLAQTAAALWILNVWFNRFDKDTGYRGGDASNMKEEFEEYGLSETTMYAVGAAKVSLAGLMLVGHAVPRVVRPASIGLAMFMLGAIGMHIKVGDPVKRYLPALSVFSLSTISAALGGDRR